VVAVAVAVYSSSVLSFKPTNSAEGYSSSFVLFFNSLLFGTPFQRSISPFVYKLWSRSIDYNSTSITDILSRKRHQQD
jgi:hypothetical protein